MTRTDTRPTAAITPAIGITAALSALGGGLVWLTTSDIGYALTAATIGLLIGIAIFAVIALSGRSR